MTRVRMTEEDSGLPSMRRRSNTSRTSASPLSKPDSKADRGFLHDTGAGLTCAEDFVCTVAVGFSACFMGGGGSFAR